MTIIIHLQGGSLAGDREIDENQLRGVMTFGPLTYRFSHWTKLDERPIFKVHELDESCIDYIQGGPTP